MLKRIVALIATCSIALPTIANVKIEGALDISYVYVDQGADFYNSWQEQGTGLLRYDNSTKHLNLRQGFVEADIELSDELHGVVTAYVHADGEQHFGITEAFLTYRPLSQGWTKRFRLGTFYPHLSSENVGKGWQSPFTYSYTTINSWIAEELRINGLEVEFTRLGRRHRQNFDISLVGGLYTGNDPLGSILSWRGWATHDRQTLFNERIEMANYPSINISSLPQPTWVEPFQEIDDKLGYYFGVHVKYNRNHDVRAYWYDNRGEPLEVASNNQYSWDTQFGSLAWKYNINQATTLLSQVMLGSTRMGDNLGVDVDYFSSYIMLSHKFSFGRLTARLERFGVNEKDDNFTDSNDSDGHSVTFAFKRPILDTAELGLEHVYIDSYNENRAHWPRNQQHSQQLWQLVFKTFF